MRSGGALRIKSSSTDLSVLDLAVDVSVLDLAADGSVLDFAVFFNQAWRTEVRSLSLARLSSCLSFCSSLFCSSHQRPRFGQRTSSRSLNTPAS